MDGREVIVLSLLATAAQAATAAAATGACCCTGVAARQQRSFCCQQHPAMAMVRDAEGRLPISVLLGDGYVEAARTVLPATDTHTALATIVAAVERQQCPCLHTSPASGRSAAQTGSWCPPPARAWALPCQWWRTNHAPQLVRRLLPAERQRLPACPVPPPLPACICVLPS